MLSVISVTSYSSPDSNADNSELNILKYQRKEQR